MVGRWPSGAPLVLAPEQDDLELGDDPTRSNDFVYEKDDARGLKCPLGAHARRMSPRDASIICGVPLHRMIRRSTSYGPMLPEGVLEDDGAERGIIFVAAGTRLDRQFEFIKTQWINEGLFFGSPDEKDPLVRPERRQRPVHHPEAPDPPPPDRAAGVRGQPRRRVLLHPQRAPLAVGARHVIAKLGARTSGLANSAVLPDQARLFVPDFVPE
jgi:hypothetical protein